MNRPHKRSVTIRGHRTSLSLEQPFLDELRAIAAERGIALAALVAEVDAARRGDESLSSALRVHVLGWLKARAAGAAAQADGGAPTRPAR
ncbi:ribbon-helix-helix domain-containing protein [Aquibium sp. A9E412]|uniref:ribbon-helix-helix domain-containing protein n=1 Tax=Aquibium sp. A9E412 TaxID=2976767 RepID=UPI0025B1715D|nr:ribbon-helix-helix domain-containing protein [Aquibium sp. A9E412]MDN2566161.1 ribbon-helix-helix domain-containing protein [Aquibium sp. A9E412]